MLDAPVLASLGGAHRHLGESRGRVARYHPEVSPFSGLPLDATDDDWNDLAHLVGPATLTAHAGLSGPPPEGWTQEFVLPGRQLVDVAMTPAADAEAVQLTPSDVPEMLDLVARTQPGPFLARTIEMGSYLGLRENGVLVAMAGERLHPPGHTEISAVCTDPAFRGRGFAARLVNAVAHGIRARGETPFLHATVTNVAALRLYASLGMEVRRDLVFEGWRSPPS